MTTPLLAVRRGRSWNPFLPRQLTLDDAPMAAGAIAVVVASMALLGWLLGIDVLRSSLPGLPPMKVNTAVALVFMGIGIGLLARPGISSRGRAAAYLLVGTATSVALATGAQYAFGLDFGIDQLLFHDPGAEVGMVVAGRMSPLSATCITLLGLAAVAGPRARRLVIALSGAVMAVSVVNVFDFVFGAAVPTFLADYTQMALNTALVLGILATGVLALLGPMNPFAALAGRSTTKSLLRRLLAVLVVVPVVMAWLRLEGQQMGLYDTSFGTSLMLVGILALGVIAILRSARWANDLEAKRLASETERDRFFELSLDMLSVIGADGRFRRVNGAWGVVLGYPDGHLVGQAFMDFVHPDDLERTLTEAAREFDEGERSVAFQNRYRHFDGSYRWLEWMSQTSTDQSVAYGVARDITDRKRLDDRRAMRERVLETRNETLSERTVRDGLTGLHNRRFFDAEVARLEGVWGRLEVDERPAVSVIIFDLDHFGAINKQHGHQAGDQVLRHFSGLLAKRFREHDLVARYGGEEFVAVLEGVATADAVRIAESIRATFEAAAIDIGTGTPIRVTVSAGCAQLGDDRDMSAGLSQADVWLSAAKRAGRNQVIGL
jgi:diguanylate cyclase (GGDEF)-like protein/PAS domain S-box-containing protein